MLLVSILCTAGAAILFYRLCRDTWLLPQPLFLASVFLFFPPRWLYFRSTGLDGGPLPPLHARGDRALREEPGRVGVRHGGARDAHEDPRPPDRRRLRPDPPAEEAVALAPVAPPPPGRARGLLRLLLEPDRELLPVLRGARRQGRAFRPFGFMPHLFELGLYHQVEYFILLAFVYGIGISRIRRFETIFVYSALQFLLHINISTEEWPRYWLVMAPFALVVGFHDIWETREAKWLFAIPVVDGLRLLLGRHPAQRDPPGLLEAGPRPARAPPRVDASLTRPGRAGVRSSSKRRSSPPSSASRRRPSGSHQRDDSPTFDEAIHLFSGAEALENGSGWLNPEHPPLLKLAGAFALRPLRLVTPCQVLPCTASPFNGYLRWLYGNTAPAHRIVAAGRRPFPGSSRSSSCRSISA